MTVIAALRPGRYRYEASLSTQMRLYPAALRRHFEAALSPIVYRLIEAGVSPNAITTLGTLVLLGAAVAFGVGTARLGGALLLLSGVLDMLDGRVARGSDRETRFGAFYDSMLDRVGEAALFGGIAVFFVRGGIAEPWMVPAVAITVLALAGGLIVSYARARAEGIGLECKVGVAQRAERILGLGLPSVLFGAGPSGFLLFGIVVILAVLATVTIVQRVVHVRRLTTSVAGQSTTPEASPVLAESSGKGRSGD